MTGRARILAGLLGAVATLVVALPLTRLFDEAAWYAPAALGVLVVAVTGMVLRALTASTGFVVLGQALTATWYVLVTQLGSTTRAGVLPSARTLPVLLEHVAEAQETITKYAAPAPATTGVVIVLVICVVLVGLAVDMSTASAASPMMAGLPLLSLFLIPAANSGGWLPWGWFLAGSSLWIGMLIHQSDVDLRAWATSIPALGQPDAQGSAERAHRWQAVRLGALGIAAAMLVPTFVPHLPTRSVLEGLGPGSGGSGDGIQLSTQLDLKRSLDSPSREPVLRYTSDDPTPPPLRVGVVEDFSGGLGRIRSRTPEPRERFIPPDPLPGVAEAVARQRRTLLVDANGVAAPQLALPTHVEDVDTGGVPWALGQDGTARVRRAPGTYSATYTELAPQPQDFAAGGTSASPSGVGPDYLDLDPGSAGRIQQLADDLAPAGGGSLASAQAIQEYLRGQDFSYSLELPEPADGPSDPVLSFLETKVGYCQQFATTMTLLARARGIPARVVVGFLPGEDVDPGDDVDERERVIRASDAHAWPELYFHEVGWVRFEPTPGGRAASVPAYSINLDDAGGTDGDPSTTSSPTASTRASEDEPSPDVAGQDTATTRRGPGRWVTWPLVGLLALAGLAFMPVTAAAARRRRLGHASDDAARVEVEWQDLLDRLDDLGVDPPAGATPRQTGSWLQLRMQLTPPTKERLDHVVDTLERARYAAPGPPLPDIAADVTEVVAEVGASRPRPAHVRALLWPRAAVTALRSLLRR